MNEWARKIEREALVASPIAQWHCENLACSSFNFCLSMPTIFSRPKNSPYQNIAA